MVLPFTRPALLSAASTHPNTDWCVSMSISRRVREIVEWSGGSLPVASLHKPRSAVDSKKRRSPENNGRRSDRSPHVQQRSTWPRSTGAPLPPGSHFHHGLLAKSLILDGSEQFSSLSPSSFLPG